MRPDQDENNKFFWRLARVKELLANSNKRVIATSVPDMEKQLAEP